MTMVAEEHEMGTERTKPEVLEVRSDASVDLIGGAVDKAATGIWKAATFILVTEAAERLAFYSIAANLVTYLVTQLHQPIPKAANIVTNWLGADYMLGLFGAFIADSYWGRYYTIAVFSCAYIVGMVLLTVSASTPSLRPPACHAQTLKCEPASSSQMNFLLSGLYIIAVGTGGIKACVSPFGGDQFHDSDERERKSKSSFFNWFYFSINMGALFAVTVMVYIQDNVGWRWGYSIPTASMAVSLALFLTGTPLYRHRLPSGSPFTRFAQVMTAAVRNWKIDPPKAEEDLYEVQSSKVSTIRGVRKLKHTDNFRFLDKAAVCTSAIAISQSGKHNPWRLCTVTQVEELKLFLRILPIIATTMFLWTGYAQLQTFFVEQGTSLNRDIGPHFEIPPASLSIFAVLNSIIVLPLYDKVLVPFLRRPTGHERGLTPLRRIGIGLFFSIASMIVAAMVERRRLHVIWQNSLVDSKATIPMTIFWLVPQYFLVGTAELFVYVGQLEFFYDEVSDAMKSVSTASFLCELGMGNWISSLVVTLVRKITGAQQGWIVDNLNASRLDKFYWVMAGLSLVNLLLYMLCAVYYSYKQQQQLHAEAEAEC